MTLKVRDALRLLDRSAAEHVNTRGSVEKWRLPSGKVVAIAVRKKSRDVSPRIRNALRELAS